MILINKDIISFFIDKPSADIEEVAGETGIHRHEILKFLTDLLADVIHEALKLKN